MTISRLAAALALAACSLAHAGPTVTVKVIGFNDFHGNLQSPGTFGVNTTVPAAQRPAVAPSSSPPPSPA